jgi:photosystem II stability/assembly factor-like uncharacterized protein
MAMEEHTGNIASQQIADLRESKHITFLISILTICFAFCNVHAQQDINGWFWLNGQPQGNTVNWVKIVDAANIFAVANRGVFMKSIDGGDTWSVNNQVGSPDNSSTGGGSTRDLNSGWFFNANTGIVVGQSLNTTPGYVSRTTNGGNNWTYIQYNDSGGTVNGIYFLNSNTGFIAGGARARVHKTTDAGITWSDISNGLPPANSYFAVTAIDANKIFLAFTNRSYYFTTNGGTSWTLDTMTTAGSAGATITDMLFKDANTGYAIGNLNYFAYTTNGGINWTQSNSSSIRGQRDLEYESGVVYTAGDYNYIYKSSNNGVTWDSIEFYDNTNINQPSPNTIIYGLDVNGNDLAVVGANGAVTISDDGGTTWNNRNYSVNPNTTLYSSMYVASPTGNIWVGPSGGGNLLFTTNGGTNWSTQTTNHTTSIFAIDFVNTISGFICGGSIGAGIGEFSKTTNGGLNWSLVSLSSPLSTSQLNSLDFTDANTGWITGGSNGFSPALIYKTTNGGTSWTSQSLPGSPNGLGVSVQLINSNTGYLKTSNTANQLYYTSNGGSNWILNTSAIATTINHDNMFVLTKDIIFLHGSGVGSTKKIVKSVDGGSNWADITGDMLNSVTIFRSKWLNLKHGVVCGTNGYTAETTNGGLSWIGSNPGFSTTVDLALTSSYWFTISDRNSAYQIGRKPSGSASGDSVEVKAIYTLGKVPVSWGCGDSLGIRLVKHFPSTKWTDVVITIENIGGGVKQTNTIRFNNTLPFDTLFYYPLPCYSTTKTDRVIVNALTGEYEPTTSDGIDTIAAMKEYCRYTTTDAYNHADPCLVDSAGMGLSGNTGNIVAGFTNYYSQPFPIHAVDQYFFNPGGGGNQPYKVVIYSDNGSGKPGSLLYISSALMTPAGINTTQLVTHNISPPISIPANSRFYVGYRQTSTTSLGVSYQNESPIRKKAFLFSSPDTSNSWTDFSDSSYKFRLNISPRTKSATKIKLCIEGFFNNLNMSISDTARAYLRNSTFPYAKVDSAIAVVDEDSLAGIFNMISAPAGSYYIQISHRNTIETWSASPVSFPASSYDFTTSASQAYGSNMVLKGSKWCIYSGDVNKDGTVDGSDGSLIDNDAFNFISGYVNADLNGDYFVDGSDASVCDNNAFNFVGVISP